MGCCTRFLEGPSVNKEYLSQIQFYSIFSELPVTSNTVVMITVCVKVANSTGFPQIKGQSGLSYRGTIYIFNPSQTDVSRLQTTNRNTIGNAVH